MSCSSSKPCTAFPSPTCRFGILEPFRRLTDRIRAAKTLTADDRAWLFDRLADLEHQWAELPPGLPRCVVHGDAWGGNVAVTESGHTYLLDLERCAVGPPEWDLASTAVAVDTVASITSTEYAAFCDLYGTDVTAWPGYTTLRGIRELRMTLFVAQHATTNPQWRAHAQHRVDCLRGREGPRPWSWKPLL